MFPITSRVVFGQTSGTSVLSQQKEAKPYSRYAIYTRQYLTHGENKFHTQLFPPFCCCFCVPKNWAQALNTTHKQSTNVKMLISLLFKMLISPPLWTETTNHLLIGCRGESCVNYSTLPLRGYLSRKFQLSGLCSASQRDRKTSPRKETLIASRERPVYTSVITEQKDDKLIENPQGEVHRGGESSAKTKRVHGSEYAL